MAKETARTGKGKANKSEAADRPAAAAGRLLPVVEHWKSEPDGHDYPAALDYLSLLLADSAAEHAVEAIRKAPLVQRKAKDLLRASRLSLLPADDPAVARDLARVHAGEKLSPVLALRGRLATGVPLTIADGYHRICASYHLDENAEIPCRLGDVARR